MIASLARLAIYVFSEIVLCISNSCLSCIAYLYNYTKWFHLCQNVIILGGNQSGEILLYIFISIYLCVLSLNCVCLVWLMSEWFVLSTALLALRPVLNYKNIISVFWFCVLRVCLQVNGESKGSQSICPMPFYLFVKLDMKNCMLPVCDLMDCLCLCKKTSHCCALRTLINFHVLC